MKLQLSILLWLTILPFGIGCQTSTGQADSPPIRPQTSDENPVLIKTAANSKYGLSLLFYKSSDAKTLTRLDVKIKINQTGKVFDLYALAIQKETADETANFWSPDEEYLILHGQRLSIIKSSELLKILSKPGFDADEFYQNPKSVDFIEILSDKQNPEFRHHFKKWADKDSFIFGISRINFADRTAANDELVEFRYDFVKKKLYRRSEQNNREGGLVYSGLSGKNKKGLIRGGAMKNDAVD